MLETNRMRRVALATTCVGALVALAGCASMTGEELVFSGSCENDVSGDEPLAVERAEVANDGNEVRIEATLVGAQDVSTNPGVSFSASFSDDADGMTIVELYPGDTEGQRLSSFDLAMGGIEYYGDTFTFENGDVAFSVPVSALDGRDAITGWSFTAVDSQGDAFCGDPFNPNELD